MPIAFLSYLRYNDSMACKKEYRYSRGKRCPVCDKAISNKASACMSHRFPTTQYRMAICQTCGRKYRYHLSQGKGRYCSRACYDVSPEAKEHHRRMGLLSGGKIQKIPDSKILELFQKVSQGELPSLYEAYTPFGYKRVPPKRLFALISQDEYKSFLSKHKERLKTRGAIGGMTAYNRGYKKELQAIRELQVSGYTALRSAGSRGPFDIIGVNAKETLLIQIKRTKRLGIDFTNIPRHYKKDIQRLRDFSAPPSSRKELWVWIEYKGWFKFDINNLLPAQSPLT